MNLLVFQILLLSNPPNNADSFCSPLRDELSGFLRDESERRGQKPWPCDGLRRWLSADSRPVRIVRHSIPEYFRTYRSGDTPICAIRSSTPLCGRFLLFSGFAIRRSEKECRATHRSPQRFVPGPAHSRSHKPASCTGSRSSGALRPPGCRSFRRQSGRKVSRLRHPLAGCS